MSAKRDRNVPPGILDARRRIISNKVMKDTIHVDKYGFETKGEYTQGTLLCKPGGGPPLHFHRSYSEKFVALEGDLIVYLDGEKLTLKPGESATVPAGKTHTFTAEGETDIKFTGYCIPAHSGFEKSLYIMYGLANDGFADEEGLPKSLVQKALIADMSDMRFTGGAGGFMNLVNGLLAGYARWSGEEERLLRKYWD